MSNSNEELIMNRNTSQQVIVSPFFDSDSYTFSYIVQDASSNKCAIIDSVLDFDYASGEISFDGADNIIEFIKNNNLKLEWLLETHVHADHLSAAPYIQEKLGGKIGIGKEIITVQETFGRIFNEGTDFQRDGSQFDHLFSDQETYAIGNAECTALHTPGHTPACMTYVIGDAVFVGDTLFMPDAGTARADFPGGDAATLYNSIQKILALPEDYRVFTCHDYRPNGREIEFQTTIKRQREENIHVHQGLSKEEFVRMRQARDKTLGMPRLIIPSLQINMRAGHFPPAENNETVYLKVPINAF